jgi:hypothetical protein
LKLDRSIFVEEMILASLTETINIDTILSTKPAIEEEEEVKISSNSDQSSDQVSSEIKITREDFTENDEVKEENKSLDTLLIDSTNSHADNLKKAATAADNDGKSFATKQKQHQQIRCLESPLSSSLNYNEHENVQQKSLPAFMAASPNASFIVSQTPLSHRSRISKGRPSSSGHISNLASLTIRPSLSARPGTIVVSPTGRRKVFRHSTEPPPN